MTRFAVDFDRLTEGWRGPVLAAVVAMLAALPDLVAMPVLDRDEARFAQASAQMAETGDIVSIRFQDQPRHKKPVGVYWLQAASVTLFSAVEKREIWPYRLPSMFGAMLAAWACAWGASAFWGARRGFIAGAILGGSMLLSTEAFIAKADAVMTGLIVLAMAALGRMYGAARGEAIDAGARTRLAFWLALAGAVLVKGPIGPMVVGLTLVGLWAWDRRADWIGRIGWGWGLVILLAVVGPWAWAITVTTDGGFFTDAVTGDMLSKLREEGQEGHGAPPGLHLLLSPILAFPMTFLIPAALTYGWIRRAEPGVRFALAWLVPSWIAFEIAPTKLPHYVLPMYGALAWLAAACLSEAIGKRVRYGGAVLGLLVAGALAAGVVYGAKLYGGPAAVAWAALAAVLLTAAGLIGAVLLLMRRADMALMSALVLGILAHGAVALAGPHLFPLWVARNAAEALALADLDPRNGITPGPVAVAGFEEPSMVFKLGTQTELTDAAGAVEAAREGRPVLVDASQAADFLEMARARGVIVAPAGRVQGLNYSKGDPADLTLYRTLTPIPGVETPDQSGEVR